MPLYLSILNTSERSGTSNSLRILMNPSTCFLCIRHVTFSTPQRCRANVAHARQSRPYSGLSFQIRFFKKIRCFPLRTEAGLNLNPCTGAARRGGGSAMIDLRRNAMIAAAVDPSPNPPGVAPQVDPPPPPNETPNAKPHTINSRPCPPPQSIQRSNPQTQNFKPQT